MIDDSIEDGLSATAWVKRGGMMINRDALSLRDPESWIQLWKDKFGTITGFPWKEVYGWTPTVEVAISANLIDLEEELY